MAKCLIVMARPFFIFNKKNKKRCAHHAQLVSGSGGWGGREGQVIEAGIWGRLDVAVIAGGGRERGPAFSGTTDRRTVHG